MATLRSLLLIAPLLLTPTLVPALGWVLPIAAAAPTRQTEAEQLVKQGVAAFEAGDYPAAVTAFDQALLLYRALQNRPEEGNVLEQLGLTYFWMEKYPQALQYLQQSLAIARELQYPASQQVTLRRIGEVYYWMENYPEAIAAYQQSLTLARDLKNAEQEQRTLLALGYVYYWQQNYDQAIATYQQSLRLGQQLQDRSGAISSLRGLGMVYYQTQSYAEAIATYNQGLKLAQQVQNRYQEGLLLRELGLTYYQIGDYSQAIANFDQSLKIAQALEDKNQIKTLYEDMGNAYYWAGQYPQAKYFYQERLALALQAGDLRGQQQGLFGLAQIDRMEGQPERAIARFEQSLTLARQLKNRFSEGAILTNLGNLYYDQQDYARAIDSQNQALAIAREVKYSWNEAAALQSLAIIYLDRKKLDQAETYSRQSIQVLESLRRNLNDSQKISIIETQAGFYKTLQTILVEQGKAVPALEIAERARARAFVDLLSQRLAASAAGAAPLNVPAISAPEIQRIAQQQAATLVTYSLLADRLLIWVIQPTGAIKLEQVPLNGLETTKLSLEQVVNNSRSALGVRGLRFQEREDLISRVNLDLNRTQPELQSLYKLLIKPIEKQLPSDPTARVIFIPQDFLFLVPFAALQDAQNQYLIEKHTILTAPSIQVLQLTHKQQQRNRGKGRGVLVVGNPTMPRYGSPPRQLTPLPGAEVEARAIADLWQTQALIGPAASEPMVVAAMQKARVIHLATHGIFDDVQGLSSAIALTPTAKDDGLLTAAQILDLNLRAELAVLSACDTGRGRITGDGVIGLSRALISAGVPSVIVSLWAIPDAPTATLMTEFYGQWQRQPDKAQALRQAMLKTKQRYPNPAAWAGFTLIGEAL